MHVVDVTHPAGSDPEESIRPLTPRSLVASLLLGMSPPRMRSADLVRWCSLFGVAPGTTRVALSRMVDRNELRSDAGTYELAGSLRERQAPQEFALDPAMVEPWRGDWSMVVVPRGALTAGERSALREALARLRHAEVRDGLWVRPTNLPPEAEQVSARRFVDVRCDRWTGRPDEALDVVELFDLGEWEARADALVAMLERTFDPLPAEDAIPSAFRSATAVLQHIRRDPLLPDELLPSPWPGERLRASYLEYVPRFRDTMTEWVRAARRSPAGAG